MSYHRVRDLAERLKEEADILRDTAANLEDGSAAEDVVEGAAEDIDGVMRRLTGFRGDIAGEPEIERWETVRWTETVEGDNGEPMTVELVEQVPVTRERQADASETGAKPEHATLTDEVQGLLSRLGTVLDELRLTRSLDEEPARKTADTLLEVAGKLEAVIGQHAEPSPEGEQAADTLPPPPPPAESGKGDRKGSKVKSPSP